VQTQVAPQVIVAHAPPQLVTVKLQQPELYVVAAGNPATGSGFLIENISKSVSMGRILPLDFDLDPDRGFFFAAFFLVTFFFEDFFIDASIQSNDTDFHSANQTGTEFSHPEP
jgi:hypothetical protein